MSAPILVVRGIADPSAHSDPDALARREELIEKSKTILTISTDDEAALAAIRIVDMARMLKECEASRVAMSAPVLMLQRLINSTAAKFAAGITPELERLGAIQTKYLTNQRLAREAEERKQREAAEAAERERQRVAAEAERVRLAEVARVERERQAALAEARRKAQEEIDDATSVREEREAKARQADAEASANTRAQLDRAAAFRTQQRTVVPVAPAPFVPAPAPKLAGVSTRKVPKFRVDDIAKLAAARPELVEMTPRVQAINAVARTGLKELPGLVMWMEDDLSVRA